MRQNHVCFLGEPSTVYPELPENSSLGEKLMHRFRRYTLISERYPKTLSYFKSKAAIKYEQTRHLRTSPFAIHPFSVLRLYWEVWMSLILLASLCFFPFTVAFRQNTTNGLMAFLDFFNLVDIVINFYTGIFQRSYCDVILPLKRIAGRYVCTHFFFDLASSFPVYLLLFFFDVEIGTFFETLRLFKIARLHTLFVYMNTAFRLLKLPYSVVKISIFHLLCLMVLHWTACVHFLVPRAMRVLRGRWDENSWVARSGLLDTDSDYVRYAFSLFRAARCIFCVEVRPSLVVEDTVLECVTFLFGKLFVAYLLVMWLQMFTLYFGNTTKHQDIVVQLNEYMRSAQLPVALQKRLVSYYRYRYNDGYFRSSIINATLSENLRKEIANYCCRNLLEKVPVFKELPDDVLQELVKKLENEIYLPNDTIVKAGSIGRCMYFLASGTVAVFTSNGKEVCHLQDGAFFGEMALMVKDHKRVATIVALEICKVYTLDKKYFRHAFSHHPEMLGLIEEEADFRMKNIAHLEALQKKILHPKRNLLRQ